MDLRRAIGVLDEELKEQETMIETHLAEGVIPLEGTPPGVAEFVQSKCICGADLARYALHTVLGRLREDEQGDAAVLLRAVTGLLATDEGGELAEEVLAAERSRIARLHPGITVALAVQTARELLEQMLGEPPKAAEAYTVPARQEAYLPPEPPGLAC